MTFSSPNYTQTPNDLFDKYLAVMGDAELRVTLVAVRKMLGFHKTREAISLTQFQKMTGLSRQGVLNGLDAAKERGVIRELEETGKRGVKLYELVVQIDQSAEETSQPSRLELVNPVDTQKKVVKERKSTPANASVASAEKPPKKERPRNPNIDAAMAAWELPAEVVVNYVGMLFHDRKVRGEWDQLKPETPVTLDEFERFVPYAKARMRKDTNGKNSGMPRTAQTLAAWLADFRKAENARVLQIPQKVADEAKAAFASDFLASVNAAALEAEQAKKGA